MKPRPGPFKVSRVIRHSEVKRIKVPVQQKLSLISTKNKQLTENTMSANQLNTQFISGQKLHIKKEQQSQSDRIKMDLRLKQLIADFLKEVRLGHQNSTDSELQSFCNADVGQIQSYIYHLGFKQFLTEIMPKGLAQPPEPPL